MLTSSDARIKQPNLETTDWFSDRWSLTQIRKPVDNLPMFSAAFKHIATRKHWLFSLLAASLLVFQTSNIVHDLDLAAHDAEADCEICDLFVAAGDDGDAIVATNTDVYFTNAIISPDPLAVTTTTDRANARRIRAPPYSS